MSMLAGTAQNVDTPILIVSSRTGKEDKLNGQLSGIQIYLTTMIVGFVVLNFLIMALRIERK